MTTFLLLSTSAVVPSILLLWYFISSDRNPEPRGVLLRTFFYGALVCIPVVMVVPSLEALGAGATGMWGSALTQGFLGAGIPEEFFKLMVLLLYVWRQPAFDEPMDGIVYGATASLGFATLENLLYVGADGFGVAVMRALSAVPCHAFMGAIMGAYVGKARFGPPEERLGKIATGYIAAVMLHGTYDTVLFTKSAWCLAAIGILAFQIRWGRRLVREARAGQLLIADSLSVTAFEGGGLPLSTTLVQVEERRVVTTGTSSRSAWSILKLLLAATGLSGCALLLFFVALAAVLPSEAGADTEGVGLGLAIIGIVTLLPTFGFVALFRSGLRGPFVPA